MEIHRNIFYDWPLDKFVNSVTSGYANDVRMFGSEIRIYNYNVMRLDLTRLFSSAFMEQNNAILLFVHDVLRVN